MVYNSLDKAKVGVRMGAQTQPKLLLAAAFAIIFVIGFLFGNMTKYCSFSRVAVKDGAITESETSIDKEAALYVDLSAPDVTLPSIAKTSDKIHHEPSSCKAEPDLSFVYFIFSVAKQVERRKAIRETWGSLAKPPCGSRVIFVLNVVDGTSETKAEMESLQAQVDKEASDFQDILQFGHILDSSRTLTNKTKATFEWFLRECPDVPYLAKGEDHTYVNRQDFEKYIVSHSQPEAIFGHCVYKNTVVFRDPKSYFYVAREDYIEETYPEVNRKPRRTFPTKVMLSHIVLKCRTMYPNTVFGLSMLT
ncbi:hypothetical protein RvY_03567-2 [Ramazzottius varieornatus]|uniref:Hexosyltransferase n=1 Tax=Ramazzottius varieornatus TaxID=947166 RepID=A0A1D1UPB1_RAMVA|nr:hypothetical protein RvY_03567-2 [Ramazzottius varieornatus]